MKSRRERRQEARKKGVPFEPKYNNGHKPVTYEEYYGVGYERFNDKFTIIKEVEENK